MPDSTALPHAFVIMPFEAEFDEMYREFIVPTFEEGGFTVSRADENLDQANILRTIVGQIRDCDIVIADLTGANPNVYYELGVAHTMKKPVILLTQDIEGLPFDIKSYRVIQYTDNYVQIKRAKSELEAIIQGSLQGTITFGNPVVDSIGETIAPIVTQTPSAKSENEDNIPTSDEYENEDADVEFGLLDFGVEFEEGVGELLTTTNEINERTIELGKAIQEINQEMELRTTSPRSQGTTYRDQQIIVARMATELNDYSRFLDAKNTAFSDALDRTRPALERLFSTVPIDEETSNEESDTIIESINKTHTSLITLLDQINSARDALDSIPHISRSLSRSKSRVIEQMRRFAGIIEQTAAMLMRGRDIIVERLESNEDSDTI